MCNLCMWAIMCTHATLFPGCFSCWEICRKPAYDAILQEWVSEAVWLACREKAQPSPGSSSSQRRLSGRSSSATSATIGISLTFTTTLSMCLGSCNLQVF